MATQDELTSKLMKAGLDLPSGGESSTKVELGDGAHSGKQSAQHAIERIKKGISYGDDMKTSTEACFRDAIYLLNVALKSL